MPTGGQKGERERPVCTRGTLRVDKGGGGGEKIPSFSGGRLSPLEGEKGKWWRVSDKNAGGKKALKKCGEKGGKEVFNSIGRTETKTKKAVTSCHRRGAKGKERRGENTA